MDYLELPGSFAELLNALPDAVIVTTADGRIVAVNSNLCGLSGYCEDDLIDEPVEMLIPGRSRAQHVALRSAYIENGGGIRSMSSRLDIVLLGERGLEVPVDVALCTIPYADDLLVIATVRDATLRRRAELGLEHERAFLSATNEVSRALLDDGDTDTTLELVVRSARALVSGDLAMLVLPDRYEGNTLIVKIADGIAARELTNSTIPTDDSLSGLAMREHEPVLITDGGKDPRLYRPPAWPPDMGPTLIVPLYASGETIGSLTIAKRRGQPMFLASDVVFMNAFAAHATLAIVDARRQEQLRLMRAFDERDRMADSMRDNVINRLYSVGLTLHVLLQHELPDESTERVWTAITELDETIAAMRDAIFPR